LPAAIAALSFAACTPARYAAGPQPAPCTDSIAARVARLPAESVTVADREHALWAQEECLSALAAQASGASQAAAPDSASHGAAAGRHAAAPWPPPPCTDSVAARVARMPAESVSVADRDHAAAARQACERALAARPPAPTNPASSNSATAWLLAGVAIVLVLVVL
jgi:hypothetical protein